MNVLFPESQTSSEKGEEKPKRVVHEALIEDKGKNVIYLRISSASSAALELKVASVHCVPFVNNNKFPCFGPSGKIHQSQNYWL